MNKGWFGVFALVFYCQLFSGQVANAGPAPVALDSMPGADEGLRCPRNQLPVAPLYWRRASAQLQWQVTDQQIGWLQEKAALQLAQWSDGDGTASPVRQQSWHYQRQDWLFWQQPDGPLHAVKLVADQLERLWQVTLPANPTWLPAPLTMLSAPLAGQATGRAPLQILVSGPTGRAVQLVTLPHGHTTFIHTPDEAGTAIANPLVFDTDMDGEMDRIYFINTQQQIWRLDWQPAEQWRPRLIARLHASIGRADAALQGWPARWPVLPASTTAGQSASLPLSAVAGQMSTFAQPAALSGAGDGTTVDTAQGDMLMLLTRQADSYGLLVVKVAADPETVLDITADTANPAALLAAHLQNQPLADRPLANPAFSDQATRNQRVLSQTPAHPMATEDNAAELFTTDHYWWLHFRGRPVQLPVVLGSVVYVPLSVQTSCPFPPAYQQVLALNLFSGAAVYGQRQLRFSRPQTDGLQLQAGATGYRLATAAETLLPQVQLVDPQCQFCLRPMTAELLTQRRWLAGYLAEEAF